MNAEREMELKEMVYYLSFLRSINFCFPSIVALFTFSSIFGLAVSFISVY